MLSEKKKYLNIFNINYFKIILYNKYTNKQKTTSISNDNDNESIPDEGCINKVY